MFAAAFAGLMVGGLPVRLLVPLRPLPIERLSRDLRA